MCGVAAAAAGYGRQQLQSVAVVDPIVEAHHLAFAMDEQLAPQPLVAPRARPGRELRAAFGECAQHVAQRAVVAKYQVNRLGA
jgi:hypothetical protein